LLAGVEVVVPDGGPAGILGVLLGKSGPGPVGGDDRAVGVHDGGMGGQRVEDGHRHRF
jgi:hypothetical protein